MGVQITARLGAQPGHPLAAQGDHRSGLRARPDRDLGGLAQDAVETHRGAQGGLGHRDRDGAVQIIAVADEEVVRLFVHLDVQIAGRTAAGADLTLRGEPDPHAVGHTGRDLDADLAAGAHPAIAIAALARVGDHLTDTGTGGARPRRHDLTEQGALNALHLAATAADIAGHRSRVGVGAAALTQIAQHRGVDGHLLGDAGGAVLQRQSHPQEGIRAGTHPADRTPRAAAPTEERLEDVTEAAETGETGAGAAGGGQRIAAEVDDAPLLRIRQHLVGGADLLEPLALVGVDVGVQFPGQLAVGAFDVGVAGVPADAEQPVIVACHACPHFVCKFVFAELAGAVAQNFTDIQRNRGDVGHRPGVVHPGGTHDAHATEDRSRTAVRRRHQ